MSIFEEFLYTREINFKEYIYLNPQPHSLKKSVDDEIFNKFAHISNENDKKTIYENHTLSGRVEANEVKKKLRIIENAEKYVIKSQDEISLLDIDPEKEKYSMEYRKNIFKLALGKLKPSEKQKQVFFSNGAPSETDMSAVMIDETVMEKEKIKLKMKEKLTLSLQNEKIKDVQQLGQIVVEGVQKQKATLILKPETVWTNSKIVSKRITPNSLKCTQESQTSYTFETTEGYKSKPLIDYVMKTETFNQDKIPLLFIYTMEVNSSSIEFTFKYKMNEKWNHKIYDFDINVYLNKEFVVLDCKSIPVANSLKNNKITWKTKEIAPHSSKSKGKILLAFSQVQFPPKQILSEIRLSMKCNCGLIEGMTSEIVQEWGQGSPVEKILLVEYKIVPK